MQKDLPLAHPLPPRLAFAQISSRYRLATKADSFQWIDRRPVMQYIGWHSSAFGLCSFALSLALPLSPSPAFLSRFPSIVLYVLARVHVPVPLSKYIYSPSRTRTSPAVVYVCVRMQIRTRHAFAREAWIERRKSTVAARSEAALRFDRGHGEFFVTNQEREQASNQTSERERERGREEGGIIIYFG